MYQTYIAPFLLSLRFDLIHFTTFIIFIIFTPCALGDEKLEGKKKKFLGRQTPRITRLAFLLTRKATPKKGIKVCWLDFFKKKIRKK